MKNKRVLITGGAGLIGSHIADLVAQEQPREIVDPRQFRPRPAREPARRGRAVSPSTIVDGDIRDTDAAGASLSTASTSSSTRPRSASPNAPKSRDWPSTCWPTGTFNVLEAAVKAGVSKVVAASSASVLGLAESFPTTETPSSLQQPHHLRRGQDLQRGAAAQLRRDVRAELRRAALFQRLRPAHGRLRRLYRGADPLDGAHRRRRSRRSSIGDGTPDHGFRPCPRHRARQHAGREIAMSPTRSSTSPAAPRPACCELADELLARHGLVARAAACRRRARSTA